MDAEWECRTAGGKRRLTAAQLHPAAVPLPVKQLMSAGAEHCTRVFEDGSA